MNTRKMSGYCLAALVISVGSMVAFAQPGTQVKKAAHLEHDEAIQSCAAACSDCQRACDSCATHCTHLLSEGKKEHLATVMSCQDCASVCAAAAQIVSRGGPYSSLICESCAKICSECHTECAKFPDDKHMRSCAEECRKCETACRAMVKQTASK